MDERRKDGETPCQSGIELPSLDLDSESDDNDDDSNIEPIIFHPRLSKELEQKLPERSDISKVDTCDIDTNKRCDGVYSKHAESNLSLPTKEHIANISMPNITEIELDNALIEHEVKDKSGERSKTCEPQSLSDSGSSGSSLMGKLEAVVSSLKDQESAEQTIIDQAKVDPLKTTSPARESKPQDTVIIDLQREVMTNRCVAQRYSSCKEKDVDMFDLVREREEIKQQSLNIIQSHKSLKTSTKESQPTSQSEVMLDENASDGYPVDMKKGFSSIPLQFNSPDANTVLPVTTTAEALSRMDSSTMKASVDEMLAKVNRMMYNISDPGEDAPPDIVNHLGQVQTLYDDVLDKEVSAISESQHPSVTTTTTDSSPETVQEYLTFDEVTGKARSLISDKAEIDQEKQHEIQQLTELCEQICNQNTPASQEGSSLSIDVDTNVAIVGWDDVLKPEQPCKSTNQNFSSSSNSPVKLAASQKQVFDSLFTNSFLSANFPSNTTGSLHSSSANGSTKPHTKLKTDILNKNRKTETVQNPLVKVNTLNKGVSTNSDALNRKNDIHKQMSYIQETLDATKQFKQEVERDIQISDEKSKNTIRELKFSDGDVVTKNALNESLKYNTRCLACLQFNKEDHLETPLKHDTQTCTKHLQQNIISSDEKVVLCKNTSTCSVGVSTNVLHLYETALTNEKENNVPPSVQQENVPPTTKSSKKKKKKKAKAQKDSIKEDLIANKKDLNMKQQQKQQQSGMVGKEKMTIKDIHEVNNIIKELEEVTGEQIFISSDASFADGFTLIPPIQNKQFLVLKIPLESPAVCKGTSCNDNVNCVVDTNQFHNFLGLVSLFLFLLQSNAAKYQLEFLDVPFDVVSLFQCSIDDELFLMIGICENDKSYLQKTKRTKLGSNFFHAVSQFIHANSLEKLLAKYLPSLPPVPASGKLSSFINIVPDENFLQKLSTIVPSVTVNSISKPVKLSVDARLNVLPTESLQQEYENVVFPHVNTGINNVINEFVTLLYRKSFELAGLKIGYFPIDGDPDAQQTILAVCTQVNSNAVEHGQPRFPTQFLRTSSTVLKLELVKWFGPKFKDINELKDFAAVTKANIKNSTVSKKKKSSVDISRLSFLCSSPGYVVFLVSSSVPSWAIPCIISVINQCGISVKNICRNTLTTEQLCSFGIFEGNSEHFGSSHSEWKKTVRNNQEVGSFTYMLLHGNSALIKLKKLTETFTDFLNNGTSYDAQLMQCFDKVPNLRSLLKKHKVQVYLKLSSKDYFAVLRLNDQSIQLSGSYGDNLGVHDSYEKITQHYQVIPHLNLAFVVVYGQQLLSQFQKILEVCFLGHAAFSNFQSLENRNVRKALLMQSLVGIKHLSSLKKHQAHDLITEDINSKEWKRMLTSLESKPAVILLLRGEDERCLRDLKNVLSSYVFSAKVDTDTNNVIVHSDNSYVFYLMLQYFHPFELHSGHSVDRRKIFPAYLEEGHPLICTVDRLYNMKADSHAIKKYISPSTPMPPDYEPLRLKWVYELHPQCLSFPWDILLRQEASYVGFSARYSANLVVIVKAVCRIMRMGFKIVGWKFPMFQHGAYWLRVVFSRADAIPIMEKIMAEIETSYPNLEFKIAASVIESLRFLKEFFRTDEYGGVLDINYLTLVHQIYFTQDALFRSRSTRVIEWHPTHDAVYNYGLGFMTTNTRTSFHSNNENLLEVTVAIVLSPLIGGFYMGKQLPRRCVFPELWQNFEAMYYKMLASKMTSLSESEADDVMQQSRLETRIAMKPFLTNVEEPFIVLVLMGSCIQSNFWLEMERHFSNEDEIETLKKYLWVSTSKRQVEYLSTAFFDQVLPNGKIEVRTSMI